MITLRERGLVTHFCQLPFRGGHSYYFFDYRAITLDVNERTAHEPTRKLYALDSWYEDGGNPARISDYRQWREKFYLESLVALIDVSELLP